MYRTLNVTTHIEQGNINLNDRGDGIQARFIPSILNFISQGTTKMGIWGYEEPENSLEYNLALNMAKEFMGYSGDNQIILTTHSPAFIRVSKYGALLYRCYKSDGATLILGMDKANQSEELAIELGYMNLLNEQMEVYEREKRELEKNRRIEKNERI